MKNIVIDNLQQAELQIEKLIDYILKWNNGKKLILYPYNGLLFREHIKLIYPYGKIKNIDFRLIENDNEFLNFIKTENLDDYNILVSCQYISSNIDNEFIQITEDNLHKLFSINKNIILFEHHKKQYSDNQLIYQYMKLNEQILENKKLWLD